MYSRATPFERADKIAGTHQKIDRAARLTLRQIRRETLPNSQIHFPKIDEILRFEGSGGPDGIKTKSPGKDEPWHFVDPNGDNSQKMFTYVQNHLENLSTALAEKNYVRASFEAGWMAHAITDALTPAHQYPMEDKIIEISGKHPSERIKLNQKMFLPGETWRKRLSANWKYLGPKGVMSSHMLYEMGVAVMITTVSAKKLSKMASKKELARLKNGEFMQIFEEEIQFVAAKKYYQTFVRKGWTSKLAKETRQILLPEISKVVALSWLEGIRLAEEKIAKGEFSKS
ncbi:MAG: hypothetical protein Q4A27_01740 [bacterium]|nr:hypothetical protein [bacterium]